MGSSLSPEAFAKRESKQNPALLIFEIQILGGLDLSRKTQNTGFICIHCNVPVAPLTNGSYRNHCPHCLYSVHIDNIPGDRANNCLGQLKPVELHHHSKKGYQIIHRCMKCGAEKINRTAPDDFDALITFMQSKGTKK